MSGKRLSEERLTEIWDTLTPRPDEEPGWRHLEAARALLAHADALQADLAAERRAREAAERVLVDLLQESHAYAAGRAEGFAQAVEWLIRERDRNRAAELKASSEAGVAYYRDVSEVADSLVKALQSRPHEPPSVGALLARLHEALEVLRQFAADGPSPGMLASSAPSDRVAVPYHQRMGTYRRAAEVLRRAEGKESRL